MACATRRIVASLGTRSPQQVGWEFGGAHTMTVSTVPIWCRMPRTLRGSGTPASMSTSAQTPARPSSGGGSGSAEGIGASESGHARLTTVALRARDQSGVGTLIIPGRSHHSCPVADIGPGLDGLTSRSQTMTFPWVEALTLAAEHLPVADPDILKDQGRGGLSSVSQLLVTRRDFQARRVEID